MSFRLYCHINHPPSNSCYIETIINVKYQNINNQKRFFILSLSLKSISLFDQISKIRKCICKTTSFILSKNILHFITLFLLALKIQFHPNRSHFLKFKYTPRLSNPRIVLLIVNRVFRNERNSKNTHERTFPPLLCSPFRIEKCGGRKGRGSVRYPTPCLSAAADLSRRR